jgi:hypothetical protein
MAELPMTHANEVVLQIGISIVKMIMIAIAFDKGRMARKDYLGKSHLHVLLVIPRNPFVVEVIRSRLYRTVPVVSVVTGN